MTTQEWAEKTKEILEYFYNSECETIPDVKDKSRCYFRIPNYMELTSTKFVANIEIQETPLKAAIYITGWVGMPKWK